MKFVTSKRTSNKMIRTPLDENLDLTTQLTPALSARSTGQTSKNKHFLNSGRSFKPGRAHPLALFVFNGLAHSLSREDLKDKY